MFKMRNGKKKKEKEEIQTWESLDMDRKKATNGRHCISEKILLKIDKVMLHFHIDKVIMPIPGASWPSDQLIL